MFYLTLIAGIVLVFCFALYFFAPILSILILLFVRSSIGVFQHVSLKVSGFSLNILGVYSLFLVLLCGINYIKKKRNLSTLFIIYYTVFIVWALITCCYAIDKVVAFVACLKLFAPMSMCILLVNMSEKKGVSEKILQVIVFSSVIPNLYGLTKYVLGTAFVKGGVMRIRSTFYLPNPFAFYLCLICLSGMCLYSTTLSRKIKIATLFILVLSLVSLVLSGTRTAFVALLVSSAVYFILSRRFMVLLISLLVIAFTISINTKIRNRIFEPFETVGSLFEQGRISNLLKTNKNLWEMDTFEWRITYWRNVISVYKKSPVLGFGVGNAKLAMVKFNMGRLEPHNDYLRLLLETGLIGFMLYIIFLGSVILQYCKQYMNTRSTSRVYAILSLCSTICLSIIMLSDNIIYANTFFWYFFAILAAGKIKQFELV